MTPDMAIWMAWETAFRQVGLTLPVAWPNEPFDPAKEGAAGYWDIGMNVTAGQRFALGGPKLRRSGLVIARLTLPVGQHRMAEILEMAGRLGLAFPFNTVLGYLDVRVRVTETAQVMRGYRDGGYWHQPVRLPWEAYA